MTEPTEPTAPSEVLAAYRTASALLSLVISGDPGAEVLVDEIIRGGDDSIGSTLGALCGVVVRIAPGLASPEGIELLRAEAARLAGLAADAAAVQK